MNTSIAKLLGATLFFVAGTLHAKPRASLLGTVVDPQGRPLPGAAVGLKRSGESATTDSTGAFRLKNLPETSGREPDPEDFFNVREHSLSFYVLTSSAPVRLILSDFSGREIATLIDRTLARGRYTLFPLADLYRKQPPGVYGLRLRIGPRSWFHRLPYMGEQFRPGLIPQQIPLNLLAKVAATELDTLVVTLPGKRTITQEVLVLGDSLPPILLFPEGQEGWQTDDPPYLKPVAEGVTLTPLLTVGESVPLTGDSLRAFRMGGIPDGLGLALQIDRTVRLLMNHEITSAESVHAVVPESARRGAYVSEFLLGRSTGRILSGGYAFRSVYVSPSTLPTAGRFSRFCSGFLAGPAEGLSLPIYMTGEESPDSLAFSRLGPQAVAIMENKAHVLPDFGKLAFENIVVVPTADPGRTVAFALEDGPARESQLYLYIGRKIRNPRAPDPVYENGLGGGTLYVFSTAGKRDEGDFTSGALTGCWVDPLRGRTGPSGPLRMAEVSAVQLEAWSRTSTDGRDSAFLFDRIEDGAYDRSAPGTFYFVTTGDPTAARNRLGRIYRLTFDPIDPLNPAHPPRLDVLAQGDSAKGFVSPDNIDINAKGQMVICEDHNLSMSRPPAVWSLDIGTRALTRLAEVDVSAVPAAMRPDGMKTAWETSGVIDASAAFGAGAWLINVQAHSVTDPATGSLQGLPKDQALVQGGQLLLLRVAQ